MSKSVTVVIRQDPCVSHKPVEALRIALGLSAGDHTVSVLLLDGSPLLLSKNMDDVVDVDILEKYLPSLKQVEISFSMLENISHKFHLAEGFPVEKISLLRMRRLLAGSDCVLVF